MGLFDTIRNFGRRSKNKSITEDDLKMSSKVYEYIEKIVGVRLDKLSDYQSYLDAAAGSIWASFRCLDMISSVVQTTKFALCDYNGEEQEGDEIISRLLQYPNTHETFGELLYLTAFHLKSTGNAYWLKDSDRMGGRVTSLVPLFPQYVKPVPHAQKRIGRYDYEVNGRLHKYEPEQIIHFKRPSPLEPHLGLGDIEAAEPLFNDFLNSGKVKSKSLERGNLPAGVLVREEFDGGETEWERARANWEQKYIGTRGAGGIAWLTGKWNFLRLAMTAEETAQVETEMKQSKDVFLHHGVPASIIGLENAANYATAKQDYINFLRFTCLPLVSYIFNRLNDPDEFIRSRYPQLKLKFSLEGLIDVEQVVKEYKPLLEMGAMTPNELREKAGLVKLNDPMLDQFYVNTNRVLLEETIEPSQEEPETAPIVPEEPETEEPEPIIEEEAVEEGQSIANIPSEVRANAQRGLGLIKYFPDSYFEKQTIKEAKGLVRGFISEVKLRKLETWFRNHRATIGDRSAKLYEKGMAETPTANQVIWMLMGGDIYEENQMKTQRWAARHVQRLEKEKNAEKTARIQRIAAQTWQFGSGGYSQKAVTNAKRAKAYMNSNEIKADLSKSHVLVKEDITPKQIKMIQNFIMSEKGLGYKSMIIIRKLASYDKFQEKHYGSSASALAIDAIGGLEMARWADEQLKECGA